MEVIVNSSKGLRSWAQKVKERLLSLGWHEYLGWVVELALIGTLVTVTVTQFLEDEIKAGWVMILLTLLICVPGVWLLLGYRPQPGSRFGKVDAGAILCFIIWIVLFAMLTGWQIEFESGPFGSPGS